MFVNMLCEMSNENTLFQLVYTHTHTLSFKAYSFMPRIVVHNDSSVDIPTHGISSETLRVLYLVVWHATTT